MSSYVGRVLCRATGSLYREGYNWQAASTIVKKSDVIVREDLHIKNMMNCAKPKHDGKGGYKRNGASRKTGLNRVIQDALTHQKQRCFRRILRKHLREIRETLYLPV